MIQRQPDPLQFAQTFSRKKKTKKKKTKKKTKKKKKKKKKKKDNKNKKKYKKKKRKATAAPSYVFPRQMADSWNSNRDKIRFVMERHSSWSVLIELM